MLMFVAFDHHIVLWNVDIGCKVSVLVLIAATMKSQKFSIFCSIKVHVRLETQVRRFAVLQSLLSRIEPNDRLSCLIHWFFPIFCSVEVIVGFTAVLSKEAGNAVCLVVFLTT
jgi:hypothetical protein